MPVPAGVGAAVMLAGLMELQPQLVQVQVELQPRLMDPTWI